MNVPRVLDALLERCGSRRFYARGESGEPHAPTGESAVQVEDWVPGMWGALAEARAWRTPNPTPNPNPKPKPQTTNH